MKKQKTLAMVAAVALIVGFTAIPQSEFVMESEAAVAVKTSAEAGKWANSKVGAKAKDFDGVHGVQCVDFPNWYADEFWGHRGSNGSVFLGGNANQFATYNYKDAPNAGWKRISKNTSGFVPMPGDVLIWTKTNASPQYGHVGIAISVNPATKQVTFAEQNPSSSVVQKRTASYTESTATVEFWGVWRPPFQSAQPATTVKIGGVDCQKMDKNMTVNVGANYTLRFCPNISTSKTNDYAAIPNGATVKVNGITVNKYPNDKGENITWANITYDGKTGWVNYEWLK